VISLQRPLHISIYEDGEFIIVENQIQLKTGDNGSLGVGLKNIDLRYGHLLEKHVEIIDDQKTFKVKLPLIYEHHHH